MQNQAFSPSEKIRLNQELERFEGAVKGRQPWRNTALKIVPLDDWSLEVVPVGGGAVPASYAGKRYGLSFLGLIHGNERAGLAVLNGVLDLLANLDIKLPFPIALGLGNPWAAKEGVRFLERDLNRSFGATDGSKLEEKRAASLSKTLAASAFMVDFHQTTELSDRPFYIFPFEERGFAFANAIGPHLSTVTHWGDAFSAEGMCSDEFVNAKGGCGITIELGQAGFDSYQVGFGIQAAFKAIATVERILKGELELKMPRQIEFTGEIFSWEAVMPYPKGEDVDLVPGWSNFKPVTKGQLLGYVDGKEIVAPASGNVLFPKYKKPQDKVRPPTELCRIMKRLTLNELPQK